MGLEVADLASGSAADSDECDGDYYCDYYFVFMIRYISALTVML